MFKLKIINNQKGVTLVVVLLMVTVFTILGMSVIGYALTNTNQVEKSEKNMQAVDIAEMGVIRYKNEFMEKAKELLSDSINAVNEANKDMKITKTESTLRNELDTEITKRRNSFLLEIPERNVPNQTSQLGINGSYTIKIPDKNQNIFSRDDKNNINKITVKFISTGKINPQIIESITTTIEFNINAIIQLKEIDNGDSGSGGDSNPGNGSGNNPVDLDKIIDRPTGLVNCEFNNTIMNTCSYEDSIEIDNPNMNLSNVNTLISEDLTITKGNIGMSNSLLYIMQDGFFDGIHGINSSKIYVGGDATFENISHEFTSSSERSTIVVRGTSTFDKNSKFSGTDVFANFGNFLQLNLTNATINIANDATFDKNNVKLDDNSKICVGGKVEGLDQWDFPKNLFSPNIDLNLYNANCPLADNSNGDTDENDDEAPTKKIFSLDQQIVNQYTIISEIKYN